MRERGGKVFAALAFENKLAVVAADGSIAKIDTGIAPVGLAVDALGRAARAEGHRIRYLFLAPASCLRLMKEQRIDIMAFATVGTSWRSAPFSVAPHELTATDPKFVSSNDLRFHAPEKSTSYEIGLKTTFMDKRGRWYHRG